MATKEKINVVLDRHTASLLKDFAKGDGVSVSREAQYLLRDALMEDMGLAYMVRERVRTFNKRKAISHRELKKRLGL